jgi:uncharacterized RDD family membrane protein YckC
MGSALLDTAPLDPAFAGVSSDVPTAATQSHAAARSSASPASTEALRRQVAERLAAHRSRRPPAQPALEFSPTRSTSAHARTARIAAIVAQRYAQSLSYRTYLAVEAERATQQAQAAAQIAALNAQAVAQAQQQLLDSLNQDSLNQDSLKLDATGHEVSNHDPVYQTQIERPAQLPRELTLWPEAKPSSAAAPRTRSAESPRPAASRSRAHHPHFGPQPFAPAPTGLTVRLFGDTAASPLLSAAHHRLATQPASGNSHLTRQEEDRNEAEARLLDEEIAFRKSPVFEEPAGPPIPLPANLIEFPRQLVATRKARPRYAEGPLFAATDPAPGQSQLRIFEVEPTQISTTPVAAEAPTPQWTSIWLDAPDPDSSDSACDTPSELAQPAAGPLTGTSARSAPLPQIASIARRLKAAAIDISILLTGFLTFAATFLLTASRSLPWHTVSALSTASLSLDGHSAVAGIAARSSAQLAAHTGLQPSLTLASSALVLALFYLLYHTLFFSFSESTPGMRCARIALCTFDDENPTRRAMRRRILAILVSVCPLGLGLLWAALDEDRLSWHDRLTRTYQRSY